MMNGFLIVNKPLGYTSRDIVNLVCKELHTKKVGHTGTLDPKATGVLVLCVGKALKMAELMTEHDKEYIAEVILGIETNTLDMDQNSTIIRETNVNVNKDKIIGVINSFKTKYMQEVPLYSSVKVNGKKLYEYARNNTPVDLPKKEVEIKDIKIIDDIITENGKIYFKIKCIVSKGTYIRSLIRDVGNALNVPAVMNSLIRTRQGNFKIEDSYTIDNIRNCTYKLVDIVDAFSEIPIVKVNKDVTKKISNGVILDKFFDNEMAFIIDESNNLLALYENVNNKSRPYKMFI